MTTATDHDRPVSADGLIIEEHGKGFHSVIAPLSGSILITNDTGRFVLEMSDGTRSTEELVAAVGARYEGAREDELRADVLAFLDTARGKEIVRW